jgi:hypothetical protein
LDLDDPDWRILDAEVFAYCQATNRIRGTAHRVAAATILAMFVAAGCWLEAVPHTEAAVGLWLVMTGAFAAGCFPIVASPVGSHENARIPGKLLRRLERLPTLSAEARRSIKGLAGASAPPTFASITRPTLVPARASMRPAPVTRQIQPGAPAPRKSVA